jgi:hypothetical protein
LLVARVAAGLVDLAVLKERDADDGRIVPVIETSRRRLARPGASSSLGLLDYLPDATTRRARA